MRLLYYKNKKKSSVKMKRTGKDMKNAIFEVVKIFKNIFYFFKKRLDNSSNM